MRLFLFILFVFSLNAFAYQSEAPENASLKMLGIEDGETYKSPIKIKIKTVLGKEISKSLRFERE